MNLRKNILICLLTLILSLCLVGSALAKPGKNSPVITSVSEGQFDPGTGPVDSLEINGENLHDGSNNPVVTLGGTPLNVLGIDLDGMQVIAEITGIPAGSLLLVVADGNKSASFALNLGAGGGGPQGQRFVMQADGGIVVGTFITIDTFEGSLSAEADVNTSLGPRKIIFGVGSVGFTNIFGNTIRTPGSLSQGLFYLQPNCLGDAYIPIENDLGFIPAFSPARTFSDSGGFINLLVDPTNPAPAFLAVESRRSFDPLNPFSPTTPCSNSTGTRILLPFTDFEIVDTDLEATFPPPYTLHRVP